MSDNRWYFTKECLEDSPSRRHGIDVDKELNYRQQAATLINDMGARKHLAVNQLCISTAMVYMHRFYVFHSFSHFQWNAIAMASLFLAAKVEEQTRKIEHVIKVAQWCLQKSQTSIDCTSESYLNQVQELVMNENILLQTLGFDVAVKHPHAFIVEFCDRLKINKDLTKTMYGMASNSLHVTTMCVRYRSSVVACFCIHFVCKWSGNAIQNNGEEIQWWTDIDPSVTSTLLEQMVEEFLADFEKSPQRLKNKVLELLQRRHISHEPSSSSLSGHGSIQLPSSSSASTPTSHHSKHHQLSMGNHNVSGPSRIHKSSTAHLPNHHHSSHRPMSISSSLPLTNGGINSNPAIASRSNSGAHASSSQPHHHQRHPQHQQQHYHHRHHALQMSSSSSHHAHKILTAGAAHNISKPKINPVTFGHLTSNGNAAGNGLPTNEPDRRKVVENRLNPDPSFKLEPHCNATAAAIASISNHRHIADPVAKTTYQKVDPPKEFNRLVPSSRSDITSISNVIKEITMAKQNEKHTEIKIEPPETDTVGNFINGCSEIKKNHSIFSPSPPIEFSPIIKERKLPIKVEPTLEPVLDTMQIKREVLPAESAIKQEILPCQVKIKDESLSITPPDPANLRSQANISHSELNPVVKKLQTMSGFDGMFNNTLFTVPPAVVANRPPTNLPKITNIVSLAPNIVDVTIKEEPCEIKIEPVESSTVSVVSDQPLLTHISTAEHTVHVDKVDTNVGESSSTSHTHKKKKKHKEKDRKHKEKKRHKDDKHHHRKEPCDREKERKEPEPIKIAIPKEKLTDIPLKIIINRNQIVTPSTSHVTKNDVAVKKGSEKASKSRKRKRESDHDHTSTKLPCDASITPQNGF